MRPTFVLSGLLALFACASFACRGPNDYAAQSEVATVDDVSNGLVADIGSDGSVGWRASGTSGWTKGGPQSDSTADPSAPAVERMLIQRGDIRVEVARPDEMLATLRARVDEWGGHLSSQSDRTIVVRIPAAKFEEALMWVRQCGRVLAESRQAQDVTEEFVDLGLRLDTAKKSRDRLLEILQKADKVEDILKVEAELRRLTEEIERMEGRRKFLADQVAMSTLSVTFQATAEAPPGARTRQRSRFSWINRVGADTMMGDF